MKLNLEEDLLHHCFVFVMKLDGGNERERKTTKGKNTKENSINYDKKEEN
jgi:hypothetical protein